MSDWGVGVRVYFCTFLWEKKVWTGFELDIPSIMLKNDGSGWQTMTVSGVFGGTPIYIRMDFYDMEEPEELHVLHLRPPGCDLEEPPLVIYYDEDADEVLQLDMKDVMKNPSKYSPELVKIVTEAMANAKEDMNIPVTAANFWGDASSSSSSSSSAKKKKKNKNKK
eukprot:g16874.t1